MTKEIQEATSTERALDLAREAGAIHIHERPKEFAIVGNDSIKAFEALVRADEREKAKHNEEVLMNALWKACGDDGQLVEATIESQGELK
jgi:hypothetical protein